jgi:hypothetical protein
LILVGGTGIEPVTLGEFFELVQLPLRGNGASWTWRIQPDAWTEFSRRGDHFARMHDLTKARKFIEDLRKSPGFGGLNTQRRSLYVRMRALSHDRLVVPEVVFPRFLNRPRSS